MPIRQGGNWAISGSRCSRDTFGLTSAEKATVKSADQTRIKKLLGGPEPICFVIGLTRSSKSE